MWLYDVDQLNEYVQKETKLLWDKNCSYHKIMHVVAAQECIFFFLNVPGETGKIF